MEDSESTRRFVVMTAARLVARAVDELSPEDSSELDVAAYVLAQAQQEFGPTHWAEAPPDQYVLAVMHLLEPCRSFSNAQAWFERLASGVSDLERRKGAPASLGEIGEIMRVNDAAPGEQLARLFARLVLLSLIGGMAENIDVPDDEVSDRALVVIRKNVPLEAEIAKPDRVRRFTAILSSLLRMAVADATALALTESPRADDQEIFARAIVYAFGRIRDLRSLDRDMTLTVIGTVARAYAERCRRSGDPARWQREMHAYAESGGWSSSRSGAR